MFGNSKYKKAKTKYNKKAIQEHYAKRRAEAILRASGTYYECWLVIVRCDCLKAEVFWDYTEMIAYCEEQRKFGFVFETRFERGCL